MTSLSSVAYFTPFLHQSEETLLLLWFLATSWNSPHLLNVFDMACWTFTSSVHTLRTTGRTEGDFAGTCLKLQQTFLRGSLVSPQREHTKCQMTSLHKTSWQNKLREESCQSIIHLSPRLKTHFLLYVVLQLKLHRRGGKLDRPCCVRLFRRSGSLQFPVFTPLFCVMMLSTLFFKGKAKSLLKIMIVIEILWSFPVWWTRKYKKHWRSRDGRVIFF